MIKSFFFLNLCGKYNIVIWLDKCHYFYLIFFGLFCIFLKENNNCLKKFFLVLKSILKRPCLKSKALCRSKKKARIAGNTLKFLIKQKHKSKLCPPKESPSGALLTWCPSRMKSTRWDCTLHKLHFTQHTKHITQHSAQITLHTAH